MENSTASSAAHLCANCSSAPRPEVDLPKAVALGLVMLVFAVFGVLGNALVILSVLLHRHWRSVTHYFIANLAAADLLLSAAVLPFSAASEALGRWVFGRALCGAWAALDVLCCTASILSLCVISVDRYLAVSYPLRYPALATGRRGLAAVAALWGVSAAISVGPLFGWKEPDPEDEAECRITQEPGYALFSALGSFYIPLAVILAMYCRVYTVVKRETGRRGGRGEGVESEGVVLRIHRGNAGHARREPDQGRRRGALSLPRLLRFTREEKAAKTLGMVVGCFVLCWLPFFLVLPIGSIFPSCKPSDTVFKITFWLGYLNSCINPIIYPCFSQEFKKAFTSVLRGRCRRTATPPGHITNTNINTTNINTNTTTTTTNTSTSTHSSGPGPTSNSPDPLDQSDLSAPCWCCCRGPSSCSGRPDPTRSLLKAWCFSARRTPGPSSNQGAAKVLQLSLAVRGEAV